MNAYRHHIRENGVHGLRLLCAGGLALMLLSACSDGKTGGIAAQVAVRVNGKDISIGQVKAVMALAPGVQEADSGPARQRVLDKLIDQQVVYAQALDRKLDRDPKVMMLLDAARREIVARAYLDSLMNAPMQITPADMHQYYVENPALFAQRKVFELEEIVTEARPELSEPLRRMAGEGRGMDEIGKFLAERGVDFKGDNGVRTAEQIPLDVLPRLAAVADGRTALIESGQRYYLVRVRASKVTPLSEAEARPRIEVFLRNQQGQRIAAQEIRRLRDKARIEYVGDFAHFADKTDGTIGSAARDSDAARAGKAVALNTERSNRD